MTQSSVPEITRGPGKRRADTVEGNLLMRLLFALDCGTDQAKNRNQIRGNPRDDPHDKSCNRNV